LAASQLGKRKMAARTFLLASPPDGSLEHDEQSSHLYRSVIIKIWN